MKGSATVDQTLGEFLVQLLLTSNLRARKRGKSPLAEPVTKLYAYLEGENLLTAWITAWKKDEDARAFYRAYQRSAAAGSPLALGGITGSERQRAS